MREREHPTFPRVSSKQPLVPGTDTPVTELVSAFLAGATVTELAEQLGVDTRVIEQALRGELRVLLWLHGQEDRPAETPDTGAQPEPAAPGAPPVPAPPAAPPRPVMPLVPPRPARPLSPTRPPAGGPWRPDPGRRPPQPHWEWPAPGRPFLGDPAAGTPGTLTAGSERDALTRAHERARELSAGRAGTPWQQLLDGQ